MKKFLIVSQLSILVLLATASAQSRPDTRLLACDVAAESKVVDRHIEVFQIDQDLLVIEDMKDGERVSTRISSKQLWFDQMQSIALASYQHSPLIRRLALNTCARYENNRCISGWEISETNEYDDLAEITSVKCQ